MLLYFTYLGAILAFLNYVILVSLITFLSLYTIRRITHIFQEKLFGLVIIFIAIIGIVMAFVGFSSPEFYPHLHLKHVDHNMNPVKIE